MRRSVDSVGRVDGLRVYHIGCAGTTWKNCPNNLEWSMVNGIVDHSSISESQLNQATKCRILGYCEEFELSSAFLVDLTKWFGTGNEPTTPIEFANRLGCNTIEDIPLYDSNTGEVVGVNHLCLPPARRVSVEQMFAITNVYSPYGGNTYDLASGEFTYTLTTAHISARLQRYQNTPPLYDGRKYFASFDLFSEVQTNAKTYIGAFSPLVVAKANEWTTISAIHTATSNREVGYYCNANNKSLPVGSIFKYRNIQLFDLTAIFGEGNEPTTVEDFYRLCPWAKDYQSYGTQDRIIGFGVEERGVNLWTTPSYDNVTWAQTRGDKDEKLALLNSLPQDSYVFSYKVRINKFLSADNIAANGAQTQVLFGYTNADGSIAYSYANLKYFDKATLTEGDVLQCSGMFRIDATNQGRYDRIYFYGCGNNKNGQVATADIFDVQLVRGSANIDYHPYHAPSLLPINTSNFPYGLHGFGGVYDEHTQKVDTRRWGKVDLETLDWKWGWSRAWYTDELTDGVPADDSSKIAVLISDKGYAVKSGNGIASDSSFGIGYWCSGTGTPVIKRLGINNGSSTEKPTGILYYQLTDPIVTPCSDPMATEAYDQGVESVVGSDAPITMAARYKDGASLPNPVVIPPASLPLAHGIGSLLSYANEITGAGDTRMGDAIKTLCDGYEKGEICRPSTIGCNLLKT